MRNQILSVLALLIFISLSLILTPAERPLASIKGDKDVPLKTTNGCSLAYTIIVNRGNSDLGFPAKIGYPKFYPLEYVSAYTLTDTIVDVAFNDVYSQTGGGNGDLKYFFVITITEVYLFSMHPTYYYGEPEIVLVDSIPTPPGYMKSCLLEDFQTDQILIVNQPLDSTSFTYSFYSIPDLALLGQQDMNIHPEKIIPRYSFPSSYFMSGDSLGIHKLFEISSNSFQVTHSYELPIEADNVKVLIGHVFPDYLLSSPGDTVINLVKYNEINLTSSVTPLMHNSSVAASCIYQTDDFLFQPVADSVMNYLNKQIIEVNAYQGQIADTIDLNQKIIAIEGGYIGSSPYDFIVGTDKEIPNDWIYFRNYWFDSIQAGSRPTWFIGDIRCYGNVAQIEKNLDIKIVPNPAYDDIQIFVSGLAENKTYDFTITDINGKMLWEKKLITKSEYSIPVQNFPSGIFILKVDAGTKSVTEKILKL